MPNESFANAVRDKLGFLLTEHGFRIVHEGEHCVRLEAVSLSAEAVLDPRGGEVDVNVFRRGYRESGMWSYVGMVGKAFVPRLLEIAGERIRAEGQVLLGDAIFAARQPGPGNSVASTAMMMSSYHWLSSQQLSRSRPS